MTDVIAKNAPPPDLSISFDAAAKLAYEAPDKSKYASFKTEDEAAAAEDVIAKNTPPPDLSIKARRTGGPLVPHQC